MRGLQGRVAVVTGGGSGIGAGAARRLSEEGAAVVIVDRNANAAAEVVAGLPGPGLVVTADVSDEESMEHSLHAALDRFGRVDAFHLNAGIPGSFNGFEIEVEEFDRVVAVNLRSVFLGIRLALRHFAHQGGGSAIVVTSSLASLHGDTAVVPYVATKHAVIGLARSAAAVGAAHGVRVNAIAPGLIDTPMQAPLTSALAAAFGSTESARAALAGSPPLGRLGTADEVGALVTFLLSDDAAFITGEVIVIDGGVRAGNPMPLPAVRLTP
jgi:NAD(P)-dependent dehydrogenase (short-subunit alcohol dehydrogenase family)